MKRCPASPNKRLVLAVRRASLGSARRRRLKPAFGGRT